MSTFDASIPRRMFWASQVGFEHTCPECGSPLEKDIQGYLMFVRDRGNVDTFIANNDAGYFCGHCPVVVLDDDVFNDVIPAMTAGRPLSNAVEYTVVGIIDFDAIPEEKVDEPFGTDDNPLPLVEFLNVPTDEVRETNEDLSSVARKCRSKKRKQRKAKKKGKKKRRS